MLTQKESDALNILRWFSTFSIVVCHLLQGYCNDWCYVANIGVQVFFFLSGFLYGGRQLSGGFRTFYWGRIVKIYIPYAIWVVMATAQMWWLSPNPPVAKAAIMQLLLLSNISGMGQMWFLRVLFICYLVLPLVDRHICVRPAITTLVLAALIVLWCYMKYSPVAVWVALYYVGYSCGHWPKIQKIVFCIATFAVVLLLASYVPSLEFFKSKTIANNIVHALCGIIVSLGFFLSLKRFELSKRVSHILTIRGGYEIYLTHCLYIFGPLTVLHFTPYKFVNIVIFIAVTIIITLILIKVSSSIQQSLRNYRYTNHITKNNV